ncbi:Hpt domain-containing protein [Maridesulfovibrio hydrothermalis]|uniref:Putative CheA signal transduction histidine kinase n=1 Tax=Maridesulfovibrio hydrothermalis AM13 = DSM 14728 TaxID=1121451 RepID=L0RB07_9BACT|nr:Hpt domain-containing protein [Maridesulfovibrio hydrothermalis]CCO23919.1 putative CheA signal transduction histidine kinase [Maridesulfovibrio hydrothermalis AM13 = DSM 14728]
MSDDDSLIEEFFSEVNDKYYPQVLEGIDLLDEQCIEEGIEALSRPLHTIKGVTGFMSGFEPASTFTHKVESFLKKMQAGEIAHKLPQIALAIESVNSIFMIIEQLRESGSYDKAATDDIEKRLAGEGKKTEGIGAESDTPVELESLPDAEIITLKARRLYNQQQLGIVDDTLKTIAEGKRILFDFGISMSVASSLFELIASYSDSHEIGITGMNTHCTSTFYSWGFQRYLNVFDSRDSFLK